MISYCFSDEFEKLNTETKSGSLRPAKVDTADDFACSSSCTKLDVVVLTVQHARLFSITVRNSEGVRVIDTLQAFVIE